MYSQSPIPYVYYFTYQVILVKIHFDTFINVEFTCIVIENSENYPFIRNQESSLVMHEMLVCFHIGQHDSIMAISTILM